MQCFYHHDQASTEECVVCFKSLCPECVTQKNTFTVCHQCALNEPIVPSKKKTIKPVKIPLRDTHPLKAKMLQLTLVNFGLGMLMLLVILVYYVLNFSLMGNPEPIAVFFSNLLILLYGLGVFVTNLLLVRGFGIWIRMGLFLFGIFVCVFSPFSVLNLERIIF